MVEPNFSMNVKADAQAEKNAEFSLDDFDSCGIEEATQIQTKILLLDSVSFDTIYTSDYITIQTGDSDKQQIFDESGEILYDQDGFPKDLLMIRNGGNSGKYIFPMILTRIYAFIHRMSH